MKVVLVEPDHDLATKIWSDHLRSWLVPQLQDGGWEIEELRGQAANRQRLFACLDKAIWIGGVGHGSPDSFHGQKVELVGCDEEQAIRFCGKFFAPCSCLLGKKLLPFLASYGVVAFGYDEVFWFAAEDKKNGLARHFIASHHSLDLAMLVEGLEAEAALVASQARYSQAIEEAPEQIRPYLYHDKKHLRLFGEGPSRVLPEAVVLSFFSLDGAPWQMIGAMSRVGDRFELSFRPPRSGRYRFRFLAKTGGLVKERVTEEFELEVSQPRFEIEVLSPQEGEQIVVPVLLSVRLR